MVYLYSFPFYLLDLFTATNLRRRLPNYLGRNIAITYKMEEKKEVECKEYKVLHIVESGVGTILLGASGIPVKKMETELNRQAVEGWQVVFQVIEQKRFMLFWKREAIIVTLGR